MADKIRWPLAIYFDASLLRRLPADLASPDLVRLTEAATNYRIGRFIPAVAIREWIFFHQENAWKKYEGMVASARLVGQYLDREFHVDRISQPELAAAVEHMQTSRLQTAGLVEIPTPPVPLEELVDLAVRKVKPFMGEDRGFRDALIVRTIAEHARPFAGNSILVVSADDVFGAAEVRQQWRQVGVVPLVAKTLEDAVTQFEAELDQAARQYLDREAEKIRAFLIGRQDEIFDRLKDVEVSEGFIRGGGVFGDPAYYGTLERVRQVRPVEITRVSRGHIQGPFSRQDGRVPVTFYVKVAFDLSIRTFSLAELSSGGSRFRLAEAVDLRVPPPGLLPVPERMVEDITVEREIPVQAWVVEGEGDYVGLIIEEVSTW